jgi:transcription antitermination factor NusG
MPPELSPGNGNTNSWVAVVVRPRAEQKAEAGLVNAGIETFVAWRNIRRRWSDRIKVIRENLFPGYVFCRSAYSDRTIVLRQPGVASVVTVDRNPAAIPNHEIDAVRGLLESGLPLGPWPFLTAGQGVRIAHGLLAGFEGTLVRDCSAWRVVVSINALQRSVAVQIDRDMVVPL